jgi:cytochrome c556
MKLKFIGAWLAAGSMMLSVAVFAHGNATGIVGERMMGMMMLGEQIKLLTPMFSPGGSTDMTVVGKAASMIEMHAGPAMTKLFPEGSIEGPSEARPEIWEEWQQFSQYAAQLAELGAELKLVASAPTIEPTPEASMPLTLDSEWDRLEVAVLLGLAKADGRATVDSIITGSIQGQPSRDPATVFADIAATCSSCHASFRR